jgi:hypothetical protein
VRVLVIPEDFRKDQYMLKPIIKAMLAEVGRSNAKVEVCHDPLLQGVRQALDWGRIEDIISRYPMVDLFLLCVDRDGESGRRTQLDTIEGRANDLLSSRSRKLLAENAWQEIEVWVLAGHDLPNEWNWADIRQERDPKEAYFLPFAQERGLLNEPGEGRRTLAEEAAHRYRRIRQLCPEDVAALDTRVQEWIV